MKVVVLGPRAKRIADDISKGNVSAAYVDLRKRKETTDTLKGADVALNAASYYFHLDAMEAALIAGAPRWAFFLGIRPRSFEIQANEVE